VASGIIDHEHNAAGELVRRTLADESEEGEPGSRDQRGTRQRKPRAASQMVGASPRLIAKTPAATRPT
jgi:hypothetical protein